MEEQRISEALERAAKHIEGNIIPAVPGRKCVDGRYELNSGEIARAGGDMGYVEVLLALNSQKGLGLTPEDCFDMVYDYSVRGGGAFYMHTDRHADPLDSAGNPHGERPLIGCGHAGKAADPEFASLYQVDPKEVEEVIRYARDRKAAGDLVEIAPLEGEHKEQGTIIVNSDHYSVNAQARVGESMYFIYDKARDDRYIEGLVGWLNRERELDITEEDFRTVSDLQTNATLHVLAQGTPIIQVGISEHGVAASPQFIQFTP